MRNLLDWYREFLAVKENFEITNKIDLSKFNFIDPEFLLLIFPYLSDGKNLITGVLNNSLKNYIDFFKQNYNNFDETQNYMPIVSLNDDNYDKILNNTFKILETKFDIKNINVIGYIIGELYNNIQEHSKSTNNYVILQHYQNLGLEISVYDNGIGISGSFKNHSRPFENDLNAIEQAISGVSTKNSGIDQATSGTGLISIKNIIKRNKEDEFIIISNKGIYHYFNGNKVGYILDKKEGLNGTLISVIFKNKKELNKIELYDAINGQD